MDSLPHPVDDFMGIFQVYSDGSVRRPSLTDMGIHIPVIDDNSVDFKEVIFDETHNLGLRLYKPKSATGDSKLPVLFFFHGGGFCFASCTWPRSHNCCLRLSSVLQALVVAPDYRLAPEHKLPAAMEDAVSAVEWLRREALVSESGGGEEWLGGGMVDFDRVFVMGDSSGGNMAHHLAVRYAAGPDLAAPLRVCGYVLLAPYFTGVERTKSEEGPREAWLTLEILDRLLWFAMPGETRDHPLMNPFGPNSPNLENVAFDPILVIAGGKELLRDRAEIYSRKLKELGKKIEYVEIEGEEHGFLQNDPYSKVSNEALHAIKTFMIENSN